ncbi:MAG: hypothetical protein ACR2JW_05735 [Thermomicrobiales bacterium]
MPGPEYEALLRRRRIWGVPPEAVAQMAAECERTQVELRTTMRELEVRLAHLTTQRDEAKQSAATLREQVERLERENAEIANRPELVREEALRFVVDAWTEAQTIREQTRLEVEKAEAAAREEVAAVRQALTEERQRHETEMREARERYEAEIATLRERRLKAIADLESLAEHLLSQATHIAAHKSPDTDPETTDLAASVPAAEEKAAMATASPPPPPEPEPKPVAAPSASTPASAPTVVASSHANGDSVEDQLLARALDDLEAILSVSRKTNGTG